MGYIETIIGFLVIFGCGLGVYLFGLWAGTKCEKPIGFWANGEPLDPKTVKDISGYNQAYGKLFRLYGIPCMVSGIMVVFSLISEVFTYVSLAILMVWGTVGLYWLISGYKKIEKQYIVR